MLIWSVNIIKVSLWEYKASNFYYLSHISQKREHGRQVRVDEEKNAALSLLLCLQQGAGSPASRTAAALVPCSFADMALGLVGTAP